MEQYLKETIFSISRVNFEEEALKVFAYQAENNLVYKQFIQYLKINPNQVQQLEQIPFLPIEFFKNQKIVSQDFEAQAIFESSGTTGQIRSQHFVKDLDFYQKVSQHIFESFYGNLSDYHILALLPSYLERGSSSLVFMVNDFIQKSQSEYSGFYLDNLEELALTLKKLQSQPEQKVLLIGVTFALLDLAEQYPMNLSNTIVMETGGMKGRRKEMLRAEVHDILKSAFQLEYIHSEYGMTELLSQAYSRKEEVFRSPPWMKVLLREIEDPLQIDSNLKSGVMNIIDLANIDSCAFIATQDLGQMIGENQFKIIGRVDSSDIRGCNLMVL